MQSDIRHRLPKFNRKELLWPVIIAFVIIVAVIGAVCFFAPEEPPWYPVPPTVEPQPTQVFVTPTPTVVIVESLPLVAGGKRVAYRARDGAIYTFRVKESSNGSVEAEAVLERVAPTPVRTPILRTEPPIPLPEKEYIQLPFPRG